MQWLRRNIANLITSVRLLGAFVLLFVPPLDIAFYIVYTLCGVSDGIDGTIARYMKSESTFGAKLDTVADLCFYLFMLIRLMPRLLETVPPLAWYAAGSVVLLRIVDYIYVGIRYHRLAAMHTVLNKVSGAMVFLVPYVINTAKYFPIHVWLLALITAISTIQEFVLHLRSTSGENV